MNAPYARRETGHGVWRKMHAGNLGLCTPKGQQGGSAVVATPLAWCMRFHCDCKEYLPFNVYMHIDTYFV